MNNTENKLKEFFEAVKNITIFQRIFKWKNIRNLSYDAYEEYMNNREQLSRITQALDESKHRIEIINKDNEHLKSATVRFETDLSPLKQKVEEYQSTIKSLTSKVQNYENTKDVRDREYQNNVTKLNQIKDQLEHDRRKIHEDKEAEITRRFESMKETWKKHEESVRNIIKDVCQRNTVEYVENVPFKGKPDNTIRICEEYIIFDAKSPSGDDLNNFPVYLKAQVENVRKYIKEDEVKKDIFLVVPGNTQEIISQHMYNLGDYNVFIVTPDSLEPIIITLQKIEQYEFAEQLTPEEREDICRLIGKFAHTTKRRIQMDLFFTKQFLDILSNCKYDLPPEFSRMVTEYEKANKLNPPQEKRAKQILTKDLNESIEVIKIEAETKGVLIANISEEKSRIESK